MMAMQTSRKGRRIEKVESPTALQPRRRTCQKRDNNRITLARLSPRQRAAEPARSFAARGKVKAHIAGEAKRAEGMPVTPATPYRAGAAVSRRLAWTPCQIVVISLRKCMDV